LNIETREALIDELVELINERDKIRVLAHELSARKERIDLDILSKSGDLELIDIINYIKISAGLSNYNVDFKVYQDRVERFMENLRP
jgi:hypothetical protein